MPMRIPCVILLGLCGPLAMSADPERQLRVVPSKSVPAIESVSVYRLVDGKREIVAELSNFEKQMSLPSDGPFIIIGRPKTGIPITLADEVTVKAGTTFDLKLSNVIGSVEVFGDNFPRAEKIVLTQERDPGPGEKGHVPVQEVKDYRTEMAAPPGFYAVWIVPANGARAQRVADRIRIQASKSVRVE